MKTDDNILKEVKSFGYDKYINIDEIVKKAISLTRQAERERILEIHQRLSDKIDSWSEYDKKFKKEVGK